MEQKSRLIILISFLVIFVFGIFYFCPTKPSSITVSLDGQIPREISLFELNQSQLDNGYLIKVNEQNPLKLNFNQTPYIFWLIQLENKQASLFFKESSLTFLFKLDQERKIDLNGDNFYDLSVSLKDISNSSASFYFKNIHEEEKYSDTVNLFLENLSGSVHKEIQKQNIIIFFVLVLLTVLIVFYLIGIYLIPFLRKRSIESRKKPSEVMDFLLNELPKNKSSSKKYKDLYGRINYFYKTLSEKEKRRYKSSIKKLKKPLFK